MIKNKYVRIVLLMISILLLNVYLNEKIPFANAVDKQTIVFFGDSITQNFEEEQKSYPDIVRQLTGFNVYNMGFGGTSLSQHPNEAFDHFSFHSLVDSIINKNFEVQKNALSNDEIPIYFEEKLLELEKIDWTTVDTIAIMYGANDWSNKIETQDIFDVTTFKGAGRASVKKILSVYPHVEILFIPTIYRFWPDYNNVDTDTAKNSHGHYAYEYSDAMIELAEEFKYPFVDTLYSLGINKYNRSLYFENYDGTHPNKVGTEKIGKKIAEVLRNW